MQKSTSEMAEAIFNEPERETGLLILITPENTIELVGNIPPEDLLDFLTTALSHVAKNTPEIIKQTTQIEESPFPWISPNYIGHA